MDNIDPFKFLAWFNAKTKHGSRLEFVLSQADDRKNESRGGAHFLTTYSDSLVRMIKKEFENDSIRYEEISEYGDVSILLSAETPEDLLIGLTRCDAVVRKWNNKYHIDKMVDND